MDTQNQNPQTNQTPVIQPETQDIPMQPQVNPGLKERVVALLKGANLGKYKLVFIGVGVFFLILIVFGVVLSLLNRQRVVSRPTPTPEGTSFQSTSMEEIKNPSKYATDPAVLKIQADVEALDKDLNAVDLKENFLRPPDIKFDESF